MLLDTLNIRHAIAHEFGRFTDVAVVPESGFVDGYRNEYLTFLGGDHEKPTLDNLYFAMRNYHSLALESRTSTRVNIDSEQAYKAINAVLGFLTVNNLDFTTRYAMQKFMCNILLRGCDSGRVYYSRYLSKIVGNDYVCVNIADVRYIMNNRQSMTWGQFGARFLALDPVQAQTFHRHMMQQFAKTYDVSGLPVIAHTGQDIATQYWRDDIARDLSDYEEWAKLGSSCMQAKYHSWWNRENTPTNAYDTEDWVLYTVDNREGELAARVLYCPKTNGCGPVYATSQAFGDLLADYVKEKHDVTPLSGNFTGARLRAIHEDDNEYLCPYIDLYPRQIELDGDYLVIGRNGDNEANDTCGTIRIYSGTICDRCCEYAPDEDIVFTQEHGYLCSSCYDRVFTTCDCCGDSILRCDVVIAGNGCQGDRVCQSCYDTEYLECAVTGEMIYHANVHLVWKSAESDLMVRVNKSLEGRHYWYCPYDQAFHFKMVYVCGVGYVSERVLLALKERFRVRYNAETSNQYRVIGATGYPAVVHKFLREEYKPQ